MAKRATPAFLRLVHSDHVASSEARSGAQQISTQESFLPSSQATTLIFLAWGRISFDDILDVFELSKPKMILDMRVAPRFDLGQLTRRQFFELLRRNDCQYVDLLGRIGVGSLNDALANPKLIAMHAAQFTSGLKPPNSGPLVFLHDEEAADDEYLSLLARSLPCGAANAWQVYRPATAVRERSTSDQETVSTQGSAALPLTRSTVFISHATPEDNDFTLWLTGKLAAAGYDVWSDLTGLQGGDAFWGNIEEVIRARAAKLVFVHSAHAKGKAGARKEVYLGLKVGERNRLPRFVVPLRIDATPFDETFIELIDVQSVDCRADWLAGLKSLLGLLQRDGVPRSESFKADQFAELVARYKRPPVTVARSAETLISNLLEITGPPQALNFFSVAGIQTNQLRAITADLSVPAFQHYALIATWASADRLQQALEALGHTDNKVALRAAISFGDFLDGKYGDLPEWKRGDARNKIFAMLHKGWRLHAEARGAAPALLANDRYFSYFQDGRLSDNKIQFADFSGQLVRRQLVGFSKKRRVFWHFGVQARGALIDGQLLYSLTPHVTFSADGKTPLPSKAQLHSLRRSFCRSWWNDRWRDLMQGFVSAMSKDATMNIDVGANDPMHVSSRFVQFTSPVSPSFDGAGPLKTGTAVSEDVEDQWDEDEFDEFEGLDDSVDTSLTE